MIIDSACQRRQEPACDVEGKKSRAPGSGSASFVQQSTAVRHVHMGISGAEEERKWAREIAVGVAMTFAIPRGFSGLRLAPISATAPTIWTATAM